jgi:hypothetical protein
LLKLDIEGAEAELFLDATDWLERTDAIVVEIHGERARARIETAYPASHWLSLISGEKLVLIRRHRLDDLAAAQHAGSGPQRNQGHDLSRSPRETA